jgi:lipopolysaccharide export system protein LptC
MPVQRERKLSRWHSRLVGLLKLVLPVTALALLGLVALWPELQDDPQPLPQATPEAAEGTSRMESPRYFGVDSKEQPYSVVARSANQVAGEEDLVDLARPQAEITLDDGRWLALLADDGRFDRAASRLRLTGDVTLYRDDGFEAHTAVAHVDFNAGDAWGDSPVEVHGPRGEILAAGFRIGDGGATLVFTGPTRLRMRAAGSGDEGAGE